MRSMSYAALVLAVCLATASCGDAEPAGRAAAHGGLSTPPEGHRWVGDEGVVVAVPDWWTTGDTHCLLPVEDTVFVESGSIAD